MNSHRETAAATRCKHHSSTRSRSLPSSLPMALAPRQPFPRRCRVLRPNEFHRVLSNCRRTNDPFFSVVARDRQQTGGARLGLAVSRKHVRRAVQRNHIKRIVRESFRRHRYRLPNLDIIVMSRRDTNAADTATLWASLGRHWRYLQLGPRAPSSGYCSGAATF